MLGFQNMVSSAFIGCNGTGQLIVEAKMHREKESFCVRGHPDSGYVLLLRQRYGFLPVQVDAGIQPVTSTKGDEGRVWEFIRVENEYAI